MLLEKGTKLFLERHLAMMDLLAGDRGNDRFFGRLANRESPVAALPAEMAVTFSLYGYCRAGFELLDQLRERRGSGKATKDMNMMLHPAHLQRFTLQARKVPVK